MADLNPTIPQVLFPQNMPVAPGNASGYRFVGGGLYIEVPNGTPPVDFSQIIGAAAKTVTDIKAAEAAIVREATISKEVANAREAAAAREAALAREAAVAREAVNITTASTSTNFKSTQVAAGNTVEHVGAKNQKLESEILRLQQLLAESQEQTRRSRQRLAESREEIGALKARFKSATHKRASEIAERIAGFDNESDGEGPESPMEPADNFDLDLNDEIREIDFSSLEDVLGSGDTNGTVPNKNAKHLTEAVEEGTTAIEDNESGSASVSGDDEKISDDLIAGKYGLHAAIPPSVLTIGLDPNRAKFGRDFRVEDSHGSLFSRGRRQKGPVNGYNSGPEQGPTTQADGEKDDHRRESMVDIFGVQYKPAPGDKSSLKTILIGNLPLDINYETLLKKVRGGRIISATLCDTTKLRSYGGNMSALVVFMSAESARSYVGFGHKHGISFDHKKGSRMVSLKAIIKPVDTPIYPLSRQAISRIEVHSQTRYLVIYNPQDSGSLSVTAIKRAINNGVNRYRAEAIEKLWPDKNGNVRILFASINAASMAYHRIEHDPVGESLKMEFLTDPCEGALSELLSKRRDTANLGLPWDDENSDSEDEGGKKVHLANPPTAPNVKNTDEIDLGDIDEDSMVDEYSGEKMADDQEIGEKPNTVLVTTVVNKGKAVDRQIPAFLETSPETKAVERATVVDEKPVEPEDRKETTDDPKISISSKVENLPNTSNAPKLTGVTNPEKTPVSQSSSQLDPAILSSSDHGLSQSISSRLSVVADENSTNITVADKEPVVGKSTEEDTSTDMPVHTVSPIPSTTSIPSVEAPVKDAAAEEKIHPFVPAEQSSTKPSSVCEAEETTVEVSPSASDDSVNKFDLSGTNLDKALIVRDAFDIMLSEKPHGGLSSSRWADSPGDSAPIIVRAPLRPSTLEDAAKSVESLLFGSSPTPYALAPADAPIDPLAEAPASRFAGINSAQTDQINHAPAMESPELSKAKKTKLDRKPGPTNSSGRLAASMYAGLGHGSSSARGSLRDFYKTADKQRPQS